MQPSAAEEEVAGLDRVLNRLALTEEDALPQVLGRLIPAVIRQLKSPHEATRKKVLELLAHVNKRVKGAPSLRLPLEDLVRLACDPTGAAYAGWGWGWNKFGFIGRRVRC
jgi:proteasome component ECM29